LRCISFDRSNNPKLQFIERGHRGLGNNILNISDRLCGLVVRVPGYRSRGPRFDSRRYQIF
jgi:hypothetical protein